MNTPPRKDPLTLSRRAAMHAAGASVLGLGVLDGLRPASALASPPADGSAREYEPLNRFPRMVQNDIVRRVREAEARGARRRAKLETRADAEAHVRDVRERIQRCFGPWPERTSLDPRVTGVIEHETYRIEKVIFESRPGFLVTANLYVPKGRRLPLPGVVGTCGHSATGKALGLYQAFAQGLARLGTVVLLYDPIGQGERLQYPNDELESRVGVGVREHLLAGNQQFLVGEFIGSWRAWDGMRALDYLLSRAEVDPAHVGVTGNSGGGTMTTWLCGVEPRFTMAAPSCFVTTFRRNAENELSADTEQCPPRALALGLDHSDFLAAMAPKPVLLIAQEKDYFDARGAEEANARLKKLYALLGDAGRAGIFVGPNYHGYAKDGREAMYGFFGAAVESAVASSGFEWRPRAEPELVMEDEKSLWCTPRGQVAAMGSRSVFSFTRDRSRALAKARPKNIRGEELRRRVREVLRLPESSGAAPDYRILRNTRSRGYPRPHATAYAVETEPGVFAIVYRVAAERSYSRPRASGKRALLWVSDLSSDAELRDEPLIRELLTSEEGVDFYTCDVRGTGESQPDTGGELSFLQAYGSDYFHAIHAIMLDTPYVGMKTLDVLRVLDWLAAAGHSEVHIVAAGRGTLPATFAAVLSTRVAKVTLKRAPRSYSEIAESELYDWPLSSLAPGVLKSFDLPDCYAALDGKLRQIDPRGAGASDG